MEIPEQLLCVWSATVEEHDGRYVFEIPSREVDRGGLRAGETYRVAVLPQRSTASDKAASSDAASGRGAPEPPVTEGDRREVEIETIGDQGDGIARVERGFVVIVPGTEEGDRVTVEITEVGENVAFAEVIDEHDPV